MLVPKLHFVGFFNYADILAAECPSLALFYFGCLLCCVEPKEKNIGFEVLEN